jgi:hypothetical protein
MTTKIKAGVIAAGAVDANALSDNSITIAHLNCSDGTNGQVLSTDGSGTLSFTDMTGGVDGIVSSADATAITIDSDENILFAGAGTGSRYLILDETNTYAGSLTIQAGAGSAGYGGSFRAYGHSHASKAGDVVAGISSSSGGSFRVNTTGIDSGSDVFVVEAGGNVGIGASIPNAALHVATSSSKIAEFERTGNSVFDLTISDAGDGDGQLWFNAQTNNTGFNFRPKSSGGTNTNALLINPDGNVGIGTTSPAQSSSSLTTLNIDGALITTNSDTSSIVYVYEQRFNGSNNLTLGYTTNGTTHTAAQISSQNNLPLVFATAGAERMKLDATGNLTQKHATDGSSRDRYTASAIPKISTVGLIGYWDPSKANAYSGSTMNDFSPSGSNDLTMGTGITLTSTADQSYWDFDGTTNANAYANIGLAAYRAASFSYWINWDNVNSLNSGYQLNGVQTANHYMYIGVQQGTNDAGRLYGYIGQGIELPTNTATGNAYVNSDEWVYLTIQIGHGNSTLTSRTQGRAEVYLNGALVTRQNVTNLPTVAATNFYLGRVDGGYYLNGKLGPAVVYHRTLHQWEILENMKVHAPMYIT